MEEKTLRMEAEAERQQERQRASGNWFLWSLTEEENLFCRVGPVDAQLENRCFHQ